MSVATVTTDMLKNAFQPRSSSAHKGSFGHSVIIGGCSNYVGAPQFAAESAQKILSAECANNCIVDCITQAIADNSTQQFVANNEYTQILPDSQTAQAIGNNNTAQFIADSAKASMLCGCGTSALAVPDFLADALYSIVKFSAIYPLKSDGKSIIYDCNQIEELSLHATAFAIGMGAGDGDTDKIVRHILDKTDCKMVVDADALVKTRDFKFSHRAILTPHIGEMNKLTQIDKNLILENPAEICKEYAKQHECIVVLKSSVSYISDGERVFINKTGNDKLAKGGSGDVLAGIIAGLLARGVKPLDAAVCGAYILGRCAELSPINAFSHLPSDIILQIPSVVDDIIAD